MKVGAVSTKIKKEDFFYYEEENRKRYACNSSCSYNTCWLW